MTQTLALDTVPANQAIVSVGRYAVTLPACPNWSQSLSYDFTNAFSSNYGCANATNLGLMVASPADLVSGRTLGPADGQPAVAAVRALSERPGEAAADAHRLAVRLVERWRRRRRRRRRCRWRRSRCRRGGWNSVMKSSRASDALKPERDGILAVLHEPATIDRIQGVIRELQLDDELSVTDTLDAALRRIRSGSTPRILLIDLGELTAPIAEVSAARAVGGADLKLIVLGTVNDVALFRDLLSAGASDYLVKPSTREALTAVLERTSASLGTTPDGLGQVIVFLGSRGGVGATTSAVSCAWLMANERRERVALVDLDLHFGTVALKLDLDPGGGLCEALEQPSRIDSLFIERAMIKVSDNLRVLAAEASAAQHVAVDAGAVDMLLHELRRKFVRVAVDLPRGVSPMHRVILAAASQVVVFCEHSLAGLRDTIRLQTLVREQAPQARLLLVEAGASGERAPIGKSEFEKGIGKSLDASLSYDPKSASAAANSGQPLPAAAPRSAIVRELRQLTALLVGPAPAAAKKSRVFALPSLW